MLRRGHFSPIHSENCLVLFTFRLEFLVCLLFLKLAFWLLFFTFLFPSTFPPSSLYLTVHSVQSSIFHTILGALQESTCCPFVIHDFPFNLNSLYSLIRSSLVWPLILIQNIKTLSFLSFFLFFFWYVGEKNFDPGRGTWLLFKVTRFSLAGVSTPKIFRAHCQVGNRVKKKGLITLNSPPYPWPTTEILGKEKYVVFVISLRQVIFHKLHSSIQSLIMTILIITKCSSELLQVSCQI